MTNNQFQNNTLFLIMYSCVTSHPSSMFSLNTYCLQLHLPEKKRKHKFCLNKTSSKKFIRMLNFLNKKGLRIENIHGLESF